MSKYFKLTVSLLLALFFLSGCWLFDDISLDFAVTSCIDYGNYAHVSYWVRNIGLKDLKDINLKIGVATAQHPDYSYRIGYTANFNLEMNEEISSSIDIFKGTDTYPEAKILGVSMDKPD